jgi:hypothetical protein
LRISERFSNRVTSGLSGKGGGMADNSETTKSTVKFAGIEVPPELTKSNFFFLFFNTFLGGMLMSFFGILQPAFLKDIIKINQDFAGSINALLMNLNEIATLALVALVGAVILLPLLPLVVVLPRPMMP